METTIKTAISLPKGLFKRAEELAAEMKVSRSKLVAMALQEFVLRVENEQLVRQINEAVHGALDYDDEKFLYASTLQMTRIAESDPDNQW